MHMKVAGTEAVGFFPPSKLIESAVISKASFSPVGAVCFELLTCSGQV